MQQISTRLKERVCIRAKMKLPKITAGWLKSGQLGRGPSLWHRLQRTKRPFPLQKNITEPKSAIYWLQTQHLYLQNLSDIGYLPMS